MSLQILMGLLCRFALYQTSKHGKAFWVLICGGKRQVAQIATLGSKYKTDPKT